MLEFLNCTKQLLNRTQTRPDGLVNSHNLITIIIIIIIISSSSSYQYRGNAALIRKDTTRQIQLKISRKR